MKPQFQIVVSSKQRVEDGPRIRFVGLGRAKLVFAGILFTVVAVAILLLILVMGSILAVIAWIVLVFGLVGVILKATIRRMSDQ